MGVAVNVEVGVGGCAVFVAVAVGGVVGVGVDVGGCAVLVAVGVAVGTGVGVGGWIVNEPSLAVTLNPLAAASARTAVVMSSTVEPVAVSAVVYWTSTIAPLPGTIARLLRLKKRITTWLCAGLAALKLRLTVKPAVRLLATTLVIVRPVVASYVRRISPLATALALARLMAKLPLLPGAAVTAAILS